MDPKIIPAEIGWRVVVPIWENDQVIDIFLEHIIGWLVQYSATYENAEVIPITIDGLADLSVLRRPDGRYVAVGDRELAGRTDVIVSLNSGNKNSNA